MWKCFDKIRITSDISLRIRTLDLKPEPETHEKRCDFAFVNQLSKIKSVSSSNFTQFTLTKMLSFHFLHHSPDRKLFNYAYVPWLIMFENLLAKQQKISSFSVLANPGFGSKSAPI
jgi:hypothetical protein